MMKAPFGAPFLFAWTDDSPEIVMGQTGVALGFTTLVWGNRKMADNVVNLFGPVMQTQPEGQPNATVIEELERLLQAARAGEIIGLAGSYVHRDKVVTYSFAGIVGSYGLIGGLDCVKERLVRIALAKD